MGTSPCSDVHIHIPWPALACPALPGLLHGAPAYLGTVCLVYTVQATHAHVCTREGQGVGKILAADCAADAASVIAVCMCVDHLYIC